MDQVPTPVPPIPPPAASEQSAPVSAICPRCHFPVQPTYYFCPNCGAKLTEAPLGTGVMDQLLLYGFSLVLPWIAYLAITKWQGIKYLRAPDPRARQIGLIALVLLIISSIIAFWQVYAWIQSYTQQSMNDLNTLGY